MNNRYPWPEWADTPIMLAAAAAGLSAWSFVLVRLATGG